MIYTNNLGLPEAIFNAVVNDDYDPGESDISCTTLIAPPRIRLLKERYRDVISRDVSLCIASLLGSAVHYVLERAAGPNELVEERYYITVDGVKIGSQFDNYHLENRCLTDYKFTSVWAAQYPKEEWDAQLNIQAYTLRENGLEVDSAQIVVLGKNWSPEEAERRYTYPQTPAQIVPIKLWSDEECLAYIKERVKIHKDAEKELPPCSDKERWASGGGWAVMKQGRKTALRVLPTLDEAKEWAEAWGRERDVSKVFYEEREVVYKRCKTWCDCNTVCDQWLMGD